jgi:formyltetrahydrofolate dehydrogenase
LAGVQISADKIYGHSAWPLFVGLLVTTRRTAAGSAGGCANVIFPEGGLHDLGTLPNGVKAAVPRVPFIDGEFILPVEGTGSKTYSPIDGQLICSIAEGTGPEVQRAAVAAHRAGQADAPWRKLSGRERGRLLYKLADIMEEHKEELASIEALDSGAVYTLAIKVHVGMSIDAFRYYAGWCDKIQGDVIPMSDSRPSKNLCISKCEPVGVCALIVPWNYPLMMLAWKMSACLAAGNTVILKPSRDTPLTALKFAELSVKAGFPPGVINIVPGSGAQIGEMLALHPMVRKVGFTGSTDVGKQIMAYCAASNLKKCSLELGGKSPLVIFEDCDMEKAVKCAVQACVFNKGENAIAAGQIFVQDSILDVFMEGVLAEVKKLKIGDPFDGNTTHGPQNHEKHFLDLLKYIERGVNEGATLMHGGKRVGEKGCFLEPAVFKGVEDHMWVAKEESFGPIILVSVFDGDIDKVVRRANAVEFGLACGVFTKDFSRALRVSDLYDGGTCFVNVWNKTDVAAPFGGFKQSGFGKDLGKDALKEYQKTKTVTIEY